MTNALFLCDGAKAPLNLSRKKFDEKIQLNRSGSNATYDLKLSNITGATLKGLSAIAQDFIKIAGCVYSGDQLVKRWTETDVYMHKWNRNLNFVVPVSDPDFWSQHEIKEQLCETLLFLTGDVYEFHFVKCLPTNDQLIMDLPGLSHPSDDADTIMLFSGGADSLGAVVEKVAREHSHPILVSHRSMPMLDNRQSRLADELRKRFPQWVFPHVSIWAHLKGREAKDYTQRSRSFLYCVLASVVAYQTNINKIVIADNGVVSINLPKSGQLVGTLASRTTHPKYLDRIQNLFRRVYSQNLSVVNPLQFKTKAEVLTILHENNCSDLLQETVSCGKTRQPGALPHCGVCSQCVDRRFGSLSANMETYDLAEKYQVDIFTDEIEEGEDRTQVESYVRFARRIQELDNDSIYKDYIELIDGIIPGDPDPDATARLWINLLRRHSEQVSTVMQSQIKKNASFLFEVALPDSCLVRLVAKGSHKEDPKQQYALRILERLRKGIPKTFQSHKPKNEHEVQDAVDGILSAAHEELHRELPLLPFAGISTKPDLSNAGKVNSSLFYIEMKYLKNRTRLNQIVTEISSRELIYKKQGAYALFGVYDPNHVIDDEKFVKDLANNEHALIGIIR